MQGRQTEQEAVMRRSAVLDSYCDRHSQRLIRGHSADPQRNLVFQTAVRSHEGDIPLKPTMYRMVWCSTFVILHSR
jgi:hypothetical protein